MKQITLTYDESYASEFHSICRRYKWGIGGSFHNPYYTPFVARNEDNEVVGFINSTGIDMDNYVCLYGLYVKPEYRHQGYAESMLVAMLKKYAACDRIWWKCKKDNYGAIRLYSKYATIADKMDKYFEEYIFIANKENK